MVLQGARPAGLLALAIDEVGGGSCQEAFVVQLLPGSDDTFLVFPEMFGEAFALGGDSDTVIVDDNDANTNIFIPSPVDGTGFVCLFRAGIELSRLGTDRTV